MFSLNKKKQLDSPKDRLAVKKSQTHFISRFPVGKTVLVLGILFLMLLLISPGSFMGKHSDSLSGSGSNTSGSPQLQTANTQQLTPEQLQSEKTQSKDFFIGPIKLSDSAYINEQLDSFSNAEKEAASQTVEGQSNGEQQFSLQDIVSRPLDFLASLGYSIRVSVSNSGKKTTFYKLVDSISRYYVSYTHFPHFDLSDEDGYSWVTEMVQANEMSGTYEYVLRTTAPVAYCGTVQQNGYCYKSDEANAVLYVRIDEPVGQDICTDQALFLLWSSQDNKTGELCMDQEPTQLGGFEFLPIRN